MSESKILQLCKEVEMLCYELYLLFADQFKSEPQAHALWSKTAAEELNHARQFDVAQRLGKGIEYSPNLPLTEVNQAREKLLEILRQCRVSPPSLKVALEGAIALEEELARFHMNYAVTIGDPSLRKMFESMMKADREHLATLQRAYRELQETG